MRITWRRAALKDIGPCLALQPRNRGDALPDVSSAITPWKALFNAPFFLSVVIESSAAVLESRLIGFGAGVLVSPKFVDAELARPREYVASRIFASLEEGRSVLATREMVAKDNATGGVDLVILYNACRHDGLSEEANHNVRMAFVNSLVQQLSGFRVSEFWSKRPTNLWRRSTGNHLNTRWSKSFRRSGT